MVNDLASGALINIGDRSLYLTCTGQGSPTVVLEAGMGSTSDDFAAVQPAVAEFTRVCSYDRAGLGKSDPAATPRTCQDQVDDLHNLLAAASIHPPYVLVGHSWNGLNVRLYASQHPEDVLGMVLIDPVHEDRYEHFEKVLSEELINRMWASAKDPARNDEKIDRLASIAQIHSARQAFNFPLLILTRDISIEESSSVWPDELSVIETDLQRELLKLSGKSKQVIAEHSGHFIQLSQPQLVIDAIHEVVEMARDSEKGVCSL